MKKLTTQRSTYIDPATGETKRIPKITGALITKNADNPEALYNLGTFCLQDKKFEVGLEILTKSLKLKDTKETRLNLATCYKMLGNLVRARALMYENIAKYPDFALSYNNLGLMLYDIRDIPEAIRLYRKALSLKDEYGDANWNLALALNLKYFTEIELEHNPPVSDFQAAMTYFEYRFRKTSPVSVATHHCMRWNGEELVEGQRLWFLCEQGIGDIIQFIRYGYNFRPDQVIFHIPEDLHFFIKKGYSAVNTTEFAPVTDYWIPLMSAAKYFPFNDAPYINVPEAIVPKEIASCDGFKIGIVWKGNPDHANDSNRSRALKDFLWLKDYGSLFSLQKDGKIGNLTWIKQLKLSHWAFTVGALNGLDIVVCVDTSIAHVCGAMGIPCIVLIPKIGIDWRWGELGENCIWYNSVRFARMQSMDEVKRLLEEFIANGNKWGPRRYAIKLDELSESERMAEALKSTGVRARSDLEMETI